MAPVARALMRAILQTLRPPVNQVPFAVTALCDGQQAMLKLKVGFRVSLVDVDVSTMLAWMVSAQPTDILEWKDTAGLRKQIRDRFHEGRQLAPGSTEAEMALDRGFAALRLMKDELSPMLQQSMQNHKNNANRDGVHYHVGQVFRHKKFGYRGVIFGWDRVCNRSLEWKREMGVDKLPSGSEQPFYWVLPDEGDCVALFGDKRHSKYVAQDNVDLVHGAELRVYNEMMQGHFEGYDTTRERYLPNRVLRHEFPSDYLGAMPSVVRPLHASAHEAQQNADESLVN